MKIAVIYATKYGHSRKVAREIARMAQREDVECAAFDVRMLTGRFALNEYDGVVLLGSVHFGRYARPLERFVARNLVPLSGMHSAFVSISGSAVTEQGLPDAEACVEQFIRLTGWNPERRACFGGAIAYTRYGFITRFLMKRIARKAGLSTDTTHDHDYTNWEAVDAFARGFVSDVLAASTSQAVAASDRCHMVV